MLKIILTMALLTSCVPSDSVNFPFGQPKYLDCPVRTDIDLTDKLSITISLVIVEAAATGTTPQSILQGPEDFNTAQRYRLIAGSASKLYLQLSTRQRVNYIQLEARWAAMCANSTNLDELVKLYFEKVDSSLQNDALVGHEYRRIKGAVQNEGGFSNAKNQSRFPTTNVDYSSPASVNFFLFKRNSFGRTMVLHWCFTSQYEFSKYIDFPQRADFWTPVAIVELSSDPECGQKVQRIYDETVAEVAQTLTGMIKENASTSKVDFLPGVSQESALSIFFDALNANFEHNSDVAVKYGTMKKRIRSMVTPFEELSDRLGPALPPSPKVVGTTLLTEMAANSVGTHFFRTHEGLNADERSHRIGERVLKLLLRLSTFDRVLELLINFSQTFTYTTLYAEKVDRLLENDPWVGPRYEEIKRDTDKEIGLTDDHFEKTKIPSSVFGNETESNRFFCSLLKRNKLARMAFLHILFIGEWKDLGLTAPNAEYNATAKAIVELSKNAKYADKVQQLYDEAITVVTEKLDILMRNASTMKNVIEVVSRVFFKSLPKVLQKDVNLATEFEITKMTYEALTEIR